MARKTGWLAGWPDGIGTERDKSAAVATRPNDALARSERDMSLPPRWGELVGDVCA
jgi:hypothetical protein